MRLGLILFVFSAIAAVVAPDIQLENENLKMLPVDELRKQVTLIAEERNFDLDQSQQVERLMFKVEQNDNSITRSKLVNYIWDPVERARWLDENHPEDFLPGSSKPSFTETIDEMNTKMDEIPGSLHGW